MGHGEESIIQGIILEQRVEMIGCVFERVGNQLVNLKEIYVQMLIAKVNSRASRLRNVDV